MPVPGSKQPLIAPKAKQPARSYTGAALPDLDGLDLDLGDLDKARPVERAMPAPSTTTEPLRTKEQSATEVRLEEPPANEEPASRPSLGDLDAQLEASNFEAELR